MPKLTWLRALTLVAFIVASVAVVWWAGEQGKPKPPPAPPPAGLDEASGVFFLPREGAGAAKLLGRTRFEVRTALGKPAEIFRDVDRFDVGVPMSFHFQDDRATALLVKVKDAVQHEELMRRWLGVGPGKEVTVNGAKVRVAPMPDDPDTLEVVVVSPERTRASPRQDRNTSRPVEAAPKPRRRATGRFVRLAAELLRGFPVVPEVLETRCSTRRRGSVTDLACLDVVDAPVDYQMATDGSWSTLTILGPQGTETKSACTDWLRRNAPGAKFVSRLQRDDELRVYFVRGPTRYLVSFLTLPRPGSGARCSLMACLEDGQGNGTACRPAD